jgi:transcriptional regulator with XRE-family HTH domain
LWATSDICRGDGVVILFRSSLGQVLRSLRTERGLTLRQVSAAARVSLGYISEVERGRKEASSELLASLCAALDVGLSDVLRDASELVALEEAVAVERTPAPAGVRDPRTGRIEIVIPAPSRVPSAA